MSVDFSIPLINFSSIKPPINTLILNGYRKYKENKSHDLLIKYITNYTIHMFDCKYLVIFEDSTEDSTEDSKVKIQKINTLTLE